MLALRGSEKPVFRSQNETLSHHNHHHCTALRPSRTRFRKPMLIIKRGCFQLQFSSTFIFLLAAAPIHNQLEKLVLQVFFATQHRERSCFHQTITIIGSFEFRLWLFFVINSRVENFSSLLLESIQHCVGNQNRIRSSSAARNCV